MAQVYDLDRKAGVFLISSNFTKRRARSKSQPIERRVIPHVDGRL
jgi:hypothetical protein